jgi:hypothetical protein
MERPVLALKWHEASDMFFDGVLLTYMNYQGILFRITDAMR